MDVFPFPDIAESKKELMSDVLYHRIPERDRDKICGMAWNRGVDTAEVILKKYPGKRMNEIAKAEGLEVIVSEKDEINQAFRTFGEYDTASRQMVLYLGSIAKWAAANQLSEETGRELVMAHEFFHFLECTQIGKTSELYQVPLLRIGKLVLTKSGIRALSEIGAHGFAGTYYEAREHINEETASGEKKGNRVWSI